MSMIVQPKKNDNNTPTTSKKDISGLSLTYQDGSKITKTLNYQDKLRATAKCENMEGDFVKFELWEDDSKGSGHNKKNTSIEKSPAMYHETPETILIMKDVKSNDPFDKEHFNLPLRIYKKDKL